jgi:cadmium resistance protein CadD (predicted permease)
MAELWQDILTGFSFALIAYAATNVDNFLALIGLAANAKQSRSIIVGFSIAAVLVLALLASFSLLAYLIPANSLQYLGIVPIAIGLRLLATANAEPPTSGPRQVSAGSVSAALAVNSVDTVATFGPLFAESELTVRASLVTGYVVAASILIWTVFHVSRSAKELLGDSKFVHLLAPITMIGIGCYILLNTGTDLEPG